MGRSIVCGCVSSSLSRFLIGLALTPLRGLRDGFEDVEHGGPLLGGHP
jgi:hypothetical protein